MGTPDSTCEEGQGGRGHLATAPLRRGADRLRRRGEAGEFGYQVAGPSQGGTGKQESEVSGAPSHSARPPPSITEEVGMSGAQVRGGARRSTVLRKGPTYKSESFQNADGRAPRAHLLPRTTSTPPSAAQGPTPFLLGPNSPWTPAQGHQSKEVSCDPAEGQQGALRRRRSLPHPQVAEATQVAS